MATFWIISDCAIVLIATATVGFVIYAIYDKFFY